MSENLPFSVILAAGGLGKRMKTSIPKQYLSIRDKPLALYSFELFLSLPEVEEIVIVCDPTYQSLFRSYSSKIPVSFALPGERRQDSVFNGIQQLKQETFVCVHDAARPYIDEAIIRKTIKAAYTCGAAVVGVPVKSTIKICNSSQTVLSTPNRSQLWEVQTPQVVKLSILKQGYRIALDQNLTVTDDVSLAELAGAPVKVVEGSYSNIKVTTPEDLIFIERLLK